MSDTEETLLIAGAFALAALVFGLGAKTPSPAQRTGGTTAPVLSSPRREGIVTMPTAQAPSAVAPIAYTPKPWRAPLQPLVNVGVIRI